VADALPVHRLVSHDGALREGGWSAAATASARRRGCSRRR
jgi:hypothetical protein